MELTAQQIRYIRLYKQGLIVPFENMEALFAALEIQAQSENDAYFNVNRRLKSSVTAEEIQEAAIRIWYVRNTIFLMGRDCYDKAVFINNFTGNWFYRMRITTPQDEADLQRIIDHCKDRAFVSVEELVELGCNESFIRVWSGAFIEMVRRGVLRSKYKKQLEINHSPVSRALCLEDILRQYFRVYGPATLQDLKHWLGKSGPEVNAAYGRIRGEYVTVNGNMLLAPNDLRLLEKAGPIPVIITGKFDPVCLAYQDKTWLVPRQYSSRVWGKAGIVEAVVLVEGAVAATWRRDKAGIRVYPLGKLNQRQQSGIAAQFRRLLGRTTEVTFCLPGVASEPTKSKK